MNAQPLYVSDYGSLNDAATVLDIGRKWLRLRETPQQLVIGSVLGAHDEVLPDGRPLYLYDEVAVEAGRRTGKTTTLLATLLGRCLKYNEYQVITTAQTALKARARWAEVATAVEDHPAVRVRWSSGSERMDFLDTGSAWFVLPPKGPKFRSEEADTVLVDESQEMDDPDEARELRGAIMPLFDTRPSGQLILAGTPGKVRSGLLWDALQRGRAGEHGIVEYGAADGVDITDETTWEGFHPGLASGLTTLPKMRKRFKDLGAEVWGREYGGRWPESSTKRAIPAATWTALGRPLPSRPRRFVIAYDVAPDQASAAIVAAWRDDDGHPWLEVIACRPGAGWLPRMLLDLSRKYRCPIALDSMGINLHTADVLERQRPRPKLLPSRTPATIAACASVMSEITSGNLRHGHQADLDAAVEVAVRRVLGEGSWVWGRVKSGGVIAPLVAGTIALACFDGLPPEQSTAITFAT